MSNDKTLVSSNGQELEVEEREEELRFSVHPSKAFGTKVKKEKTKGGIYLPDSVNTKESTPIVKLEAIGQQFRDAFPDYYDLEVGDFVYVNPMYIDGAKIDDVIGFMLPADSIFGKIPQDKIEEDE